MEAKAKLDAAQERRKRRRRRYKLKRKLERREKARREAERAANLQMTGSGSSHGGSIDMLSSVNGSVAGNSQSSVTNHSDETESYVTRYTSRRKLSKNIVEVITLLESSDSEDEMVRITRKMREREYK